MFDELRYEIKSWAAWITGKGGVSAVKNGGLALVAYAGGKPVEHVAGVNAWTALGGVGALMSAGVSTFLAHMEYNENHRRLLSQYRPEIAAKMGKDMRGVGKNDLFALAQGEGVAANPVLEEELRRISTQRTLKIGVSLVTSIAVFAGIAALSVAAAGTIPMLGMLAIGVVGGLAVGQTLGYVGEKMLGLDGHSAHEQVAHITHTLNGKGRVSQEQVMGVFVAADRALEKAIKKEYGAPYPHLALDQQKQVVAKYAPGAQMAMIAEDLNNRQIRPSELAFSAVGQASGIVRLEEPPTGFGARAQVTAAHIYQRGRENVGYAYDTSVATLSPYVESGREKLAQGYTKLVETGGRMLSGFRNAQVEGAVLSPEKSAQTLPSLEGVKGKWQNLVSSAQHSELTLAR